MPTGGHSHVICMCVCAVNILWTNVIDLNMFKMCEILTQVFSLNIDMEDCMFLKTSHRSPTSNHQQFVRY